MSDKVRCLLVVIVYISVVAVTLWIRFNNSTLTETQLLLEYWYVWLGVVGVTMFARWLLRK